MVVAGVMSGTSADGVDVAVCRIWAGGDGEPRVKVLGHRGVPVSEGGAGGGAAGDGCRGDECGGDEPVELAAGCGVWGVCGEGLRGVRGAGWGGGWDDGGCWGFG